MSAALAEAPSEAAIIPAETYVSAEPVDPAEQNQFKDIFSSPPDAPLKEIPKKAPKPASDALKPPTKDEALKDKTDASKEPKDDKNAKRWDKLGELKKPEPVEEEPKDSQSTEQDTEKEPDPKAGEPTTRWKELKATETAAKKSETIDDILKIPALSEKARAAIEALKTENEGYKTNGSIPEAVKQRQEWLEQKYANDILDSDPGFQREVMYPINKAWTTLGDIAKEAGLDATTAQALANAVKDMSGVSRSLAIRKIISKGQTTEDGESSPLPDETIATLSQLAIASANELHDTHWPKEVAYRQRAREISDSISGKDVEMTAAQKAEADTKFGEEAKRLSTIIKEKMPLVFEQHPDALDAILTARPSKEMADQVFDAQSGHLVNFLAKTLNSTLEKMAKLEASLKAREKAKPNSNGDGRVAAPQREDAQPSFEEVFGRR